MESKIFKYVVAKIQSSKQEKLTRCVVSAIWLLKLDKCAEWNMEERTTKVTLISQLVLKKMRSHVK